MASAALRFTYKVLLLILVPTWMCQCACKKAPAPETLYEQVRTEARRGDLDAALRDVERAFHEYSDKDVNWAWRFRVLNAHILVLRGSNSEALQLLKESLPLDLSTSETAVRKNLVSGMANDFLQQFDIAERDLREAEDLARSYQPSLLAEIEQSRGQLEMDREKYPEAEADFHGALSAARAQKQPFLEVSALGSLGNAAMSQEHFDVAVDWYKAALELAQSIGMQSSVARARGSMGWSRFQLGDFEGALKLFQEGADLSKKSGLVADRIYWLTGVAESQFALQNYVAAEDVLQQALTLAKKQDDKRILVHCLNDLSVVMLGTGRPELAQKYNQEALDFERASLDRSGVLDTKMVTARIDSAHRDVKTAEILFQEIIGDRAATKAIQWEAKARLAKLYDDENLVAKAESRYLEAIATFEEARASVSQDELRLSFLSGGIEYYDDYVQFLMAHARSSDALKAAELSRARTLTEGLSSKTGAAKAPLQLKPVAQAQPIAKHLKATILFYWVGQKHSYLWVITPETTTCLTLPPASEIAPAVKEYRDAVAELEDVAATKESAAENLYKTLVEPAQKFIAPNTPVVILPDASLYSLNFETLIVPGPKPHFWIEDVTLTTASSLSLLASAAKRIPPRDKNLLLVGDALKASDGFEPLPNAEQEMKIVEDYFPESNRTVLKRQNATPAAYLAANPERYAYLHFVTHGTASRAQPLESAVILSKEPPADNYKLYARDIVTHRLNAELVTISACNGSGTRTYSGEGLVGLSWAFLRAGAHNVIGALWEVSDAPSTAQLMDAFYKGISHGQDPASALRAAKLSLLHSDSVFKKPYYWAPFQLYAGS